MKRNILFKSVVCLTAMLGATSCHDYLDNLPLDKFPEDVVWDSPSSAQVFVNGTYNATGFLIQNDDWSDNSCVNGQAVDALTLEQITEDNDYGWNQFYWVRRCNLIIEKVSQSNFPANDKNKLLGEGYFLRALVNFNQARKFGRLIIVDKVLTPEDDMNLSRTKTIKETYDFILNDLDEAIAKLPKDVAQGRISKGAAYALKAEVCLQGAAYLENDGDKQNYYQQAKAAGEGLFGLDKYSLDSDFAGLFNVDNVGKENPEIILAQYKLAENTTFQSTWMQGMCPNMNKDKYVGEKYGGSWEKWALKTQFEGWLERTPSHDLTDAFLVVDRDGKAKKWDEASYYTKDYLQDHSLWVHDALYKNRDARFDATIVCDSSVFYTNLVTTRMGGNVHYLSNKEQPRHVSKSGYLWRKCMYEAEWLWYSNPTNYHYVLLRLGRSYLNHAETLLRLGDKAGAIEYLNKTRTTHGQLPALETSTSLEDTWKYYKIERRADLALENDRYWSLLRWGKEDGLDVIPELNRAPKAISISADGKTFEIIPVPNITSENTRVFTSKHYLLPVPRHERNENPNLANDQNPGW